MLWIVLNSSSQAGFMHIHINKIVKFFIFTDTTDFFFKFYRKISFEGPIFGILWKYIFLKHALEFQSGIRFCFCKMGSEKCLPLLNSHRKTKIFPSPDLRSNQSVNPFWHPSYERLWRISLVYIFSILHIILYYFW